MLNVNFIFWLTTLTFTLPLFNARPRNSRQAGTPTACESRQHLSNSQGTFSSPNFPGPYPANSSCNWILTPPKTANFSLKFTSFNIHSNLKQCGGKKCRCDYVQLKELDPPQNAAGFNTKFCNDNPPNRVYNLMSRVRIRFVSNSAEEGTGFELTYKTLESPSTASAAFDFTQVQARAALRAGKGLLVNQTVARTTSATGNITDNPTQSATSQNLNTSGVDIPLSAFTSKAPMNSTVTADTIVQLTSKTPTPQGINSTVIILIPSDRSGPTTFPRTFPVTGLKTRGSAVWTKTAHVVMAVEEKKVEEKVPDIIILGPSVPVVMIFVLVVAGIAWWNYKFNSQELNRYESYAKSGKAKRRHYNMKNISKGNLYNQMTKNWKGQAPSGASGFQFKSSPMAGRKISFAGRLLEIAEGVRTPRPSRPPSEEVVPLNRPFLSPSDASTGGGSRPSSRPGSRPASLLLRDALVNMFGGADGSDTQDSCPPSKRASKRVSFIDEEAGQPLVQHDSTPPAEIQEKHDESVEDDKGTAEEASQPVKPSRRLQIPAIVVRQPSEDCDDVTQLPVSGRRYPVHEDDEPEVISAEEFPDLEASLPVFEENDGEEPGRIDEDDRMPTWDDHDVNYPDSSSEEISDRSLIFPDLEDFLLNLDKDSLLDEPPYSCESHIRDILRKSYGDEGLSSLGPNAVLNVPEEFLGMIRGSPQSYDKAMKDTDQVDDVD